MMKLNTLVAYALTDMNVKAVPSPDMSDIGTSRTSFWSRCICWVNRKAIQHI